ncbi:MAG: hypothetical protein V4508_10355 [Pseudomonadota bacterium]
MPDAAALSSADQIEQLADQLSGFADALHARIMKDLRSCPGAPPDEAAQAIARALLDDEQVLRQRADGLYADAATLVVGALAASQRTLVALTADAAEKVRQAGALGEAVGLVAGVLMLAGAAAAGQGAPIMLALEKIARQLKALAAGQPEKLA